MVVCLQMEVVPPPLLELNGQELSIQSLAGVGAQSIVYVCKAGPKPVAAVAEGIPAVAISGSAAAYNTAITYAAAAASPKKIATLATAKARALHISTSLSTKTVPAVGPASNAAPGSSTNTIATVAGAVHVRPGELYAVKLPRASTGTNEMEKSILVKFANDQPHNRGVIRMHGETSNGALVLSPVGTPLSFELLRQYPRYYRALPEFMANLKAAHKVALHRDLRYNNIILYVLPDGSLLLVVIDW